MYHIVDDLAGPARAVPMRCVLWKRNGWDANLMNPNEVDLGASSRNGLMMYTIDGGEQT